MKIKHKLLSILLAIFLILPCFTFVGCGSKPDDPTHTHSWSADWSKDNTYHWHSCSDCSEKKDKSTHDGENCSICGYTATSGGDGLEVVSNVRDLEIITYDTGTSGVFTLVKLPDGKNMVIDAGNDTTDAKTLIRRNLKNTQAITTIDYFVLTNTNASRTGQSAYIVNAQNFEVKNFFTPREINDSASACYETALINTPSTCNVVEVAESNCDITHSFKDEQNNTYTYAIDFMLPVATDDCAEDLDASIAISIEYTGKTVLISGDATEKAIHGYYDKYNGQKDVDILITSFVYTYPYAIVNSKSSGKDYLASISLEQGDYAIISPIAEGTNVGSLTDKLVDSCQNNLNVFLLADESGLLTAYVSITSAGVVSVTAE